MVKGAHEGFCHILATESALKFIRDAFCIALIVPFILKILKVSFWFFGQDKTKHSYIRKIRLISKVMTPQYGKQIA